MPDISRAIITRRHLIAASGAGLIAGFSPRRSVAAAKLGDDGLYQMDWYLESFLDLAEDLAGATSRGKRFAIIWGLKGCPACKRMHTVHLADSKIENYIRENFEILHLNILGSREVTDFGGKVLGEKALSAAYGIKGTPTIQFFPESTDGLAAMPAAEREVARLAALPEPAEFLAMFRYVREKGYDKAPFADWLKQQA